MAMEIARHAGRHRGEGNARATRVKAKRAVAAILRYLTLLQDEILERFPAGQLPPVDKTTLRTAEELAPYIKEPGSPRLAFRTTPSPGSGTSRGWRPLDWSDLCGVQAHRQTDRRRGL